MLRVVVAMYIVATLVASCTRADATPPVAPPRAPPLAPPVAAAAAATGGTPVPPVGPKPPHDELWQEVAKRVGVDEAAMRACKETSDCTSLPHFTACCSFIAVAKTHAGTVTTNRAKLKDLQTAAQELQCRTGECGTVESPVACMQGWCVLDPYRDVWTKVAPHTGMSPEDMRACTTNDDCTLARSPERCCDTVAVAKTAHAKVTALGDKLMTKEMRDGCAIKKCGEPNWTAICNEGLCQVDFAP